MNRQELTNAIRQKKSFLCVGLDTDVLKIPVHLRSMESGVLEFNKAIIDATKDHCIAYKINTAFYEALGVAGWSILEETVNYIPATHLKIADAKRGDIGSTSAQYAKTFFETYNFDAVTVSPYMGEDSLRPFLEYVNKFTIVLGLTSNKGASDFELLKIFSNAEKKYLYEEVLEKVSTWGSPDNLMFVVGATQATQLQSIRKIIPDNFLLIPGVGAQGGSLEEVSRYGLHSNAGLLVNASRAIIYAGKDLNFAGSAASVAKQYSDEMKTYLVKYSSIL